MRSNCTKKKQYASTELRIRPIFKTFDIGHGNSEGNVERERANVSGTTKYHQHTMKNCNVNICFYNGETATACTINIQDNAIQQTPPPATGRSIHAKRYQLFKTQFPPPLAQLFNVDSIFKYCLKKYIIR